MVCVVVHEIGGFAGMFIRKNIYIKKLDAWMRKPDEPMILRGPLNPSKSGSEWKTIGLRAYYTNKITQVH